MTRCIHNVLRKDMKYGIKIWACFCYLDSRVVSGQSYVRILQAAYCCLCRIKRPRPCSGGILCRYQKKRSALWRLRPEPQQLAGAQTGCASFRAQPSQCKAPLFFKRSCHRTLPKHGLPMFSVTLLEYGKSKHKKGWPGIDWQVSWDFMNPTAASIFLHVITLVTKM